jgi:predicted ArsR family transcriptional regulator
MEKTSYDRILFLLKSKGAQTASDIGGAMDITTPGAQQKLAKLAEDGLISFEDRKHGRGRPHRFWLLTEKGHGRFPDRHSDLTLELLKSTKEIFGEEGLDKLIKHREDQTLASYSAELTDASDLESRLRKLSELRSREGYMATYTKEEDGSYLLIENHCPVCAAATFCQGLCRSELDIFQVLLGPDVTVERTDHVIAGARRCAYRISA